VVKEIERATFIQVNYYIAFVYMCNTSIYYYVILELLCRNCS